MDRVNTQLPQVNLPDNKRNWFASHYMWGYAFLALAFLLTVAFIYQMQYNNKPNEAIICIQVMTPAKNPQTGEIKEFPTPCDVPEGWQIINQSILPISQGKTFTAEEYGIKFEYPSDMVVEKGTSNKPGYENGTSYTISYPESKWSYAIDIKKSDMKPSEAYNENYNYWLESAKDAGDFSIKDLITTNIEVDNLAAKKLFIKNFGDVGANMVTVVYNGYVYLIAGGTTENDLDEFLSNFEFIN